MPLLARKLSSATLWLGALAAVGCGKSKEAAEPAQAPAEPAAEAASAKGEGEAAVPDLGMPVQDYVAARTLERCAMRYGESERDGLTLAVDQVAGRAMQDPALLRKARELAEKGMDNALRAEGKTGPVVDPAAEATVTGLPAQDLTPGGRIAPRADDPAFARYQAAVGKAAAFPQLERQVEDAVASCHFSPKFGLISSSRIEEYIRAFVEVTCLGEKIGKPGGPTDAVAHARAAAQIFQRFGANARDFSSLGLEMARFDDVTAKIAKTRAQECPDPRQVELTERKTGHYVGKLFGKLEGSIDLVVHDGDAKGTLTFAVKTKGKRKGKADDATAEKAPSYKLVGVIDGRRAHLQGGNGMDWIRLDCDDLGAGRGKWEAMQQQKSLSGIFALKQDKPEEAAKPPESPPAAVLGAGLPVVPEPPAEGDVGAGDVLDPKLGSEQATEPSPMPAAAAPPEPAKGAGPSKLAPAAKPDHAPGKVAADPAP
ncbi:MAG: hypothetical protein H6747_02365 [Deltaproteobacteria bacterium]|nr:hypothetical protein [Deltaproteobacteria bacterium]